MKPLHVGLLVVGAALAGGLAVRMSQAPPAMVSASSPRPVAVLKQLDTQPLAAPASLAETVPPPVTTAPPPVYEEPPHVARSVPASVRKPSLETPKPEKPSGAQPKVTIARAEPMNIGPAPYQEPPPVARPAEPLPSVIPAVAPAPTVEPAAPVVEPRRVTLYQGAAVAVRLNHSLSTEHMAAGDSFEASLSEPLIADGLIVAERGARVTGHVISAKRAGRFGGTAEIELALATVQTADGQRLAISTEPWVKRGDTGAGFEMIIGAISARQLNLPSETVVRFRLASRVTITERSL